MKAGYTDALHPSYTLNSETPYTFNYIRNPNKVKGIFLK